MRFEKLRVLPWNLWARQVEAIVRLELKRNLFARRALWVYLLALGPAALTFVHALAFRGRGTPASEAGVFAAMFQVYFLRLGIFLGCVGIFSNLLRGEFLERTLHYYLLSPVRRELLLVAKYVSGVAISAGLFSVGVALTFVLMGAHFGDVWQDYLLRQGGLEQLRSYLLVTVLACAGYGAAFLLAGMVVRNPMVPAALIWLWEAANAFLPSVLKKFSVIFYLKSLSPVSVPVNGPMAVLATNTDPTPAWLAVPGLIVVSAAMLALAARRARTLEINYVE